MAPSVRRALLALCIALSGCGALTDPPGPASSSVGQGAGPYTRTDLGTLTYRAVDMMLAGAPDVTAQTPLIVASVSDVRDVESTSPFGNIVADMVRTRLAQDGRAPSELRLRNAVSFKKGEGEFLLSRDRRALMKPQNAAGIVTGTYAVAADRVYVSLKLVSAADARILSGADFEAPLSEAAGMLPDGGRPPRG